MTSSEVMPLAVILAGGDAPTKDEIARLPAKATIIAVDAGLDHAHTAGLKVSAVVGDMDSVSTKSLTAAEAAGIPIHRHPTNKDQTDLELALEMVSRLADKIIVLGAGGGRLDHLLGNLTALASPKWQGIEIEAWLGAERVVIVRGEHTLDIHTDDTVSLLALGETARVQSNGLAWELHNEELQPFSGRGISNKASKHHPQVTVSDGVVLAVIPAISVTSKPAHSKTAH